MKKESITRELVDDIEQHAWEAAGEVGRVDALPDGMEWMEATAEAVGVPTCVVEAIVGDMLRYTRPEWQQPQRSIKISR